MEGREGSTHKPVAAYSKVLQISVLILMEPYLVYICRSPSRNTQSYSCKTYSLITSDSFSPVRQTSSCKTHCSTTTGADGSGDAGGVSCRSSLRGRMNNLAASSGSRMYFVICSIVTSAFYFVMMHEDSHLTG
jgi:hypothetical protein